MNNGCHLERFNTLMMILAVTGYWLWPATGYNRGPLLRATANDVWHFMTFHDIWHFVTFDILLHLTFRDIWHFVTFDISWHLTFRDIWHFVTFYISWHLTFHAYIQKEKKFAESAPQSKTFCGKKYVNFNENSSDKSA